MKDLDKCKRFLMRICLPKNAYFSSLEFVVAVIDRCMFTLTVTFCVE